MEKQRHYKMEDLIAILSQLRGENGCPWDREQTHHSIRKNFLEETYEVLEAIDSEESALLQEELGDVLLQVVFHAQIENEENRFGFDDVVQGICEKLIVRHPHVFGSVDAKDSETVLRNWDQIKRETKQQSSFTQTLQSVPAILPALMRASKLHSRAKRAGFIASAEESEHAMQVGLDHLIQARQTGDDDQAQQLLGTVLFWACGLANAVGADAEELLTAANNRFVEDFATAEEESAKSGKGLAEHIRERYALKE